MHPAWAGGLPGDEEEEERIVEEAARVLARYGLRKGREAREQSRGRAVVDPPRKVRRVGKPGGEEDPPAEADPPTTEESASSLPSQPTDESEAGLRAAAMATLRPLARSRTPEAPWRSASPDRDHRHEKAG